MFATVAVLVFVPGAALAQRTVFAPTVSLRAAYYRNLTFTEGGTSDSFGSSMTVVFPVHRNWATGSWSLTYIPSYLQFQDFQQGDTDDHRFRFSYSYKGNRKSTIGLGVTYTFTQDQGNPEDLNESEIFLTERTQREIFGASVGYGYKAKNLQWGVTVGGDARTHSVLLANSPCAMPDPTDPSIQQCPQDRYSARLGTSLGKTLSEGFTVTGNLDGRRTFFEGAGETALTLRATASHPTIGPNTSLSYGFGLFAAQAENSLGETQPTRMGLTLQASVGHDLQNWGLRVSLNHSPSAGGNLIGTSTNTTLGISMTPKASRNWSWNMGAVFGYRSTNIAAANDVMSASIKGGLTVPFGRSLGRVLGMRLDGKINRQFVLEGGQDGIPVANVGLSLVWSPLGNTALGGGA